MKPACFLCKFSHINPWTQRPTYSTALCLGKENFEQVWIRADKESASMYTPPLHTFCLSCNRITWIARHEDPQEALVQYIMDRQVWNNVWNRLGDNKTLSQNGSI